MIIASGQPADSCCEYSPFLGLVLSANAEVAHWGSAEGKDVRTGFPALILKQTNLSLCAGYMQHISFTEASH